MVGGETGYETIPSDLSVLNTFAEYDDRQETRDFCGVAAATSELGAPLVAPIVQTLYNLQHRGHQAAGVMLAEEAGETVFKNPGYVREALARSVWGGYETVPLKSALGHVRYSTTKGDGFTSAQPSRDVDEETGLRLYVAHNGNLVNSEEVGEKFGIDPKRHESDSLRIGSTLLAAMVQIYRKYGDKAAGQELELAMEEVMPQLIGAASLVLYDGARTYGYRDPNGFRPLALGRRAGDGWALASESSVLPNLGATFNREIQPGELITLWGNNIRSRNLFRESPDSIRPSLCLMEYIYLARPDTVLGGLEVEAFREETGRLLAKEHPLDVDAVVGVPETGMSAAMGYSEVSGIPMKRGLVKNANADRTFIARTQRERRQLVREKFQLIKSNIAGLRLGMVEDSIVRGTTSSELGIMLKEAGAIEVHWLVASPPVTDPCFMGINTGTHTELAAAVYDYQELQDYLKGDSVNYLSMQSTMQAVAKAAETVCRACFTGDYPIEIPVSLLDRTV